LFFFFQAEDGIRDATVTGVQTCALPILSAFRRTGFQSVTAALADPSAAGLAALKESIARDRRLSINVLREPEYYAKQASILSRLIGVLGYSVAMFMAIGATFGAVNCM